MRVPAELLTPVVVWAREHKRKFRPNGIGRQYGLLSDFTPPREAWEIKRLIVGEFGLHGAEQEPVFQDLCGFITAGGAIHPHTDPDHNGKQHVRFNVMVSKPELGGMPVQDGKEITVEEGDVWRCDASRVKHWCTSVVGSKPRIVLSFGFLI
jgi:hypothetical protein